MVSIYQNSLLVTRYFWYGVLCIILSAIFSSTKAQTADSLTSRIMVTGRYSEKLGMELRWLPERRETLYEGLLNGFILERKPQNATTFTEIARIRPYTLAQWDSIIAGITDEVVRREYLVAKEFQIAAQQPKGGSFSLDNGIAELKKQKNKEDLGFVMALLFSIRFPLIAKAMALSYVDKTVIPGQTYTYRVRLVSTNTVYTTVSIPQDFAARVNTENYKNKVYFYEGDTGASFVWEETTLLTGYIVDRKREDEPEFTRLNKTPNFTTNQNPDQPARAAFQDSNLVNYKRYLYRFSGYNIFGELIMFDEVSVMPRDRTAPEQPHLENPIHSSPTTVSLNWKMAPTPAPDLLGFLVGRSESNQGEFTPLHQGLLPKETRSLIDTTFVRGKTNYYVVQALDTAYNVSSSFPISVTLIDTLPPSMPRFLSGKIDSLGVVTLEVERNAEVDLMGYRLFRANDLSHEFSVIQESFAEIDTLQSTIKTTYQDTVTLNSITPKIYYKLKALDFNYNQSPFSEAMVIVRPDTIPPITPVFTNVITGPDQVELHFVLSTSDDVKGHYLYRKLEDEENWEIYASLDSLQTTYTDTVVTKNKTYEYSMRAYDQNALFSEYAFPVAARPYDTGVRKPIENLKYRLENSRVLLEWSYPDFNENTFFVVYKKDAAGFLRQHRRVTELTFDEAIQKGSTHTYAVRAYTRDGGQSVISKEITVTESQ